ncbi:MAG TPA: type VI secretion system-associated protein TagF [Albitalea sp.]|uniref:type VI secretion system-associated protein TagF n=1 Tax=Piscinibacter sp. TaxID=1903157 RepID=UPI002ED65FD4
MAWPVPAPDARDMPGWYGKLASLGDFAQRRLPPAWLHACDAWLSAAMQSGRDQLGERWLETYLTAPLLRFGWAPGVVDGQWWFGLLMPSCDSVGRYYPLLIAHPRTHAPEDRIALDHLELWFDHLAQAAMRTLNDTQGTVEALEAALSEAPPWPTPGRSAGMATRTGVQGDHLRLGRSATLSQWLHALAAQQLSSRFAGCTLWWRVTETGADDSVDIVRGLPDGAGFVALLTGSNRR